MDQSVPETFGRRSFIAVATSVALGGCAGETETTPESGSTGESTPTATGAGTQTDTETSSTETSTAAQSASVAIGEVVEDDSLAMVVRGVEKAASLGEFQEAESGNTYVVVEMAVKNKSSSEFVDFSSFWQTRLKDGSNHVYDQTVAVTENPMRSGQLAPGEVSRGDVVYEVPEDASDLSMQFDFSSFDLFSFSRVTVDLSSTASEVADLSQDLAVDVRSPGESVSKQDLTVTLHGSRTATELGSFASADEGTQYVIPDVSVTNNTGEPLSVSIVLQMVVKDGTGQAYTADIGGLSALDKAFAQGSEIAPGETRRGEIAYQVPEDAAELFFAFEFSLLADGDKTFWSLSG
jgi:hypothetical protein